ncbi:MAG: hypothetical protein PHT07_01285 [Paludibacter sp.]|nr:hypothetical protein [Paludibacter sp.]
MAKLSYPCYLVLNSILPSSANQTGFRISMFQTIKQGAFEEGITKECTLED